MKTDSKKELEALINESSLDPADKKEWKKVISVTPVEYLEGILALFRKFPNEIGWFNNIFKQKREAFSIIRKNKSKGEAMFRKIVEEEKRKLDKLE